MRIIMSKNALIITGYSKTSTQVNQLQPSKELHLRGYEIVIIDPFIEKRKDWLFRNILISDFTTQDIINTVEKSLDSTWIKNTNIAFFYGYGTIPGCLQKDIKADKNIFLSPMIGRSTLKLTIFQKMIKSMFKNRFSALRDIDNESFQKKIIKSIFEMGMKGENIFFLPKDSKGIIQDERSFYSPDTIASLFGSIYPIRVRKHNDMISNKKVINTILDIIDY